MTSSLARPELFAELDGAPSRMSDAAAAKSIILPSARGPAAPAQADQRRDRRDRRQDRESENEGREEKRALQWCSMTRSTMLYSFASSALMK